MGTFDAPEAGNEYELREIAPGTPEYAAAAEVRYDALYADWDLPRSLIADTDGRVYVHVAAMCAGRVVGYARIHLEEGRAHVYQVSVARDWRGRGVGAALVADLVGRATEAGRLEVTLDAREHVIEFYERLGFVREGELFLSGRTGTPHVRMRLSLPGTDAGG